MALVQWPGGQEEYHQLQQEIRAIRWCITGWREDGRNGYLWSRTPGSLLPPPTSRGREVVAEVLGDEFEGVLVSDFYGVQRASRAASEMLDPSAARHPLPPNTRAWPDWAQRVREVYDQAQAFAGSPGCRKCSVPRVKVCYGPSASLT